MSTLDDFLQMPPQQVLAELTAVRAEKALLERKETILEQIAAIIVERGDDEQTVLAGSVGSLRDHIRAVMESRPDRKAWVPRAVLSVLQEQGNTATLDHVRVTMRRMAESGELVQPRSNSLNFRLPSADS